MSLLGRLEDLSLPDIIQIVFLSRRTGMLEIVDEGGRSSILFHHGLMIDASAPGEPDLGTLLRARAGDSVSRDEVDRMIEEGAPLATALVELGVLDQEELAGIVRDRIVRLVTPLLESRDGEFNFILSDVASQFELEYDPDSLFREGGIAPQQVLGTAEGEKLKPLSGLEESMRAGKALLAAHRRAPAEASRTDIRHPPGPERTELEALEALVAPEAPDGGEPLFETATPEEAEEEPFAFDSLWEEPAETVVDGAPGAEEPEVEAPAPPAQDASVPPAEVPEDAFLPARAAPEPLPVETLSETVLLYEPDPLLRVAARRAFTRKGFEFLQFGNLADTREAAADLLGRDRFFVTFLDLVGTDAGSDSPELLLETIKSHDGSLPVVLIDREPDLRRRHELLALGADFYLTKPSPGHLQPGFAEETLGLFAEELMMFAERSFGPRRPRAGTAAHAAARELAALSARERNERGFALLRRLISELTDPDDLGQLAETILRMAEGYLDRGVLFAVTPEGAEALSGYGETGSGDSMAQRVRRITIRRADPSVLRDVIEAGAAHRGKLRRTAANETLLRALGTATPTEVAVLPIAHRGAVVGVLYGDNGRSRRPLQDLSGLEIFLSQAGLALENALSANARSHGWS